MLENSVPSDVRLQDNPLALHLQTFAASLVEEGYADETIRSKLGLLAEFGRWFGRTELAITYLPTRLHAFPHRCRIPEPG